MITSEEDADIVQETAKQPAKDIRDRKLVPEHQELDSKVVRCLYTEDFLRGFTNRNTLDIEAINVSELERFDNDTVVTIELLMETGYYQKRKRRR